MWALTNRDVYLAPERENKALNTALFLQCVQSPFKTFLSVSRTIKTLKRVRLDPTLVMVQKHFKFMYILLCFGEIFKFYFANEINMPCVRHDAGSLRLAAGTGEPSDWGDLQTVMAEVVVPVGEV